MLPFMPSPEAFWKGDFKSYQLYLDGALFTGVKDEDLLSWW
jgi:hypothetical protein